MKLTVTATVGLTEMTEKLKMRIAVRFEVEKAIRLLTGDEMIN